jgi:hypothetical protein
MVEPHPPQLTQEISSMACVTLGQAFEEPGREFALGSGVTVWLEDDWATTLHFRGPSFTATVQLEGPGGGVSPWWSDDQDLREWIPKSGGVFLRDATGASDATTVYH